MIHKRKYRHIADPFHILSRINNVPIFPGLKYIFNQIMDYRGQGNAAVFFYKSKLYDLMAFIIQYGESYTMETFIHKEQKPDTVSVHDKELIYYVQSYIEDNLCEDFTLENLAQLVYMSPSKLKYTFKSITGFTLRDYKKNLVIQKSSHLLSTTDLSIQEIAVLSGYKKSSAFSALFRKETGLTPRQFRYNIKNERT